MREDPLLAGIDDNPVFDAFRRRRVTHKNPWHRLETARLTAPTARGGPTAGDRTRFILTGIGWSLLTLGTAYPAFVQCLKHSNRRAHAEATSLPRSISAVCQPGGNNRTVLRDLVLTGCSGRQIAQAIYAERIEHARTYRFIVLGFLIAIPVVLFLLNRFGNLVPFHLIVGTVLMMSLAISYGRMEIVLSRFGIAQHLQPLVVYWAAESNRAAFKKHFGLLYRQHFWQSAIIIVLVPAFLIGPRLISPALSAILNAPYPFGLLPLLGIVLVAFLCGVASTISAAKWKRDVWAVRGETCLAEADAAFEHYVQTVLLSEDA